MLSQIMSGFIIIAIGLSIIPAVHQMVLESSYKEYSIPITVLYIIVILGISLLIEVNAFRRIISATECYEDEDKEPIKLEPKPHKQTYFEYVKERLSVEKMMRSN